MPILPSRSREIHDLVARLGSESTAERESAVARLTLFGSRALPAIFAALPGSGSGLRRGALDVIERIGDAHARPEVLALCRDQDREVARRALAVLPAFADPKAVVVASRILAEGPADRREAAAEALSAMHARGLLEAIEPLLDVVLDEEEGEGLRLFAFDALMSVDARSLEPLLSRLAAGRGALARKAAARRGLAEPASGRTQTLLRDLAAPGLRGDEAYRLGSALKAQGTAALPALHVALEQASRPLELEVLGDVLGALGAPASIPVLSRALQRLSRGPGQDEDAGQAAVAARLHLALADLGSRIALFDLRERLDARPPRAGLALLLAAERVGDKTLLLALARLHAREPALAPHAARAFAAIVTREGLRRGSPKDLSPPDRQAMGALWATLRTKTPPKPRKA
jgi:hypothetical protein